jgi:type II secretory pathway pseudopilin PulG
LEVLVVVGCIVIASTVAMVQMRQSMAIVDADKAANTVASQIRYARQIAVDQRRTVLLEFVEPNEIKVTRQGDDEAVMSDVFLPTGFRFALPADAVDTPENYGAGAAVYFNAGTSGTFLGDGTFVDASGVILNGTVFTLGSGNNTARAVTLTGASGRTKQYQMVAEEWAAK